MIDTDKMTSDIVPIFLCLLLVTNILSGVFFIFDVQRFYDHSKYLQIPNVYADTNNPSSFTDSSLTSSQTLNDDNGQGPPTDNGQGPPTDNGQGPPTDNGQGPPTDNGQGPPTDNGQGPPTDNGQGPPTDNGQGPPPGEGQGPPPGEGQGPPPGEGQGPPGEGQGPPGEGQGPPGEGQGPPGEGQGPATEGDCFDGIDGDADGKINRADNDCSGGPPPSTVPGARAGVSPVDDQNRDNQFSGNIVPVLRNGDSQTILGTAFRNNLLPIQAEAELLREDNCDDGQDNNHNGLRDSEDPSCGAIKISSVGFGLSPLIPQQSNASIISISGEGKHDIRTISLFHYRYSPEKLTIEKGSMVVWINQDPDELHGINLIDKISGKTLFSYPVIRFGASAYYQFQEAGQFTYSDPMFPSMTGEITAVS